MRICSPTAFFRLACMSCDHAKCEELRSATCEDDRRSATVFSCAKAYGENPPGVAAASDRADDDWTKRRREIEVIFLSPGWGRVVCPSFGGTIYCIDTQECRQCRSDRC